MEVTDDGSATSAPAVHVPDVDADGGRGLWLMDLLATAWGFHHDGAGKVGLVPGGGSGQRVSGGFSAA
ncbi:hypothetical protein AB0M44_03050 [Streptosporangium subroseum]|uniref:hypothetical protein n=1 Tax=Streptosporangium subroseum TaxID=106412 RepID=UPI0034225D59